MAVIPLRWKNRPTHWCCDAADKLVKEVGGQGSVTYKVMLNRPSLVSLLLEADNGGRKAYAGLNLDLTTGKEFEVTDFFVDNDNVKAALGNYDNVLFGEEGLFVRSKKNAAYSSFVPYRDVVTPCVSAKRTPAAAGKNHPIRLQANTASARKRTDGAEAGQQSFHRLRLAICLPAHRQ